MNRRRIKHWLIDWLAHQRFSLTAFSHTYFAWVSYKYAYLSVLVAFTKRVFLGTGGNGGCGGGGGVFTALMLYKNVIELCQTHFMHCLPSLSALPCLQLCDSFSTLVWAHYRIRFCLPFFLSAFLFVCVSLLVLPPVCHCRYMWIMSTCLYTFVLMCITLLVCDRPDITAMVDWA